MAFPQVLKPSELLTLSHSKVIDFVTKSPACAGLFLFSLCSIFHTGPSLRRGMIASNMRITTSKKLLKSARAFSKLAFLLIILAGLVFAQDASTEDTQANDEELASAAATAETASEANEGRFLVVNELGFGVGYPTYQLYHAYYSFQREQFGVAFKGSYTASDGIFLSVAGRYYTPLPVPVPTFVSLGAGISGGGANISATFGAHVPFGLDSPWRATLEAGLAYVGNQGIRPIASLGVGYVFYVDAAPLSEEELRRRELLALGNCREDQLTAPNPDLVDEAFDQAVKNWIDQRRSQYAGVFTGLRYDIDVEGIQFNEAGDEATVEASFSGSVREVASGNQQSASGDIEARFGWTGCSWRLLGYQTDVD
jgi:hypothetical protein